MKTPVKFFRHQLAAFTLIELLVVIAIIAILAAMLLPAINRAKIAAQVNATKADMQNLGVAIKKYEADYNGRLPAPGVPTGVQDVTYGYTGTAIPGQSVIANNRDIVAVLLNLEKFGDGTATTNVGKIFNPRGLVTWDPKKAPDNTSAGLGPDGNLRDPWGGQIVISLDTSMNDRTRDALYGATSVSQNTGSTGFYGLSNPSNIVNQFELSAQYMIWSRGPDGQIDPNTSNQPNGKANKGLNRDNVLGWQ